jgi:hypothetical protein
MTVLVVLAAWLLLAPVAAVAVSAALRLADTIERPGPTDVEAPCPVPAEPVGAVAARA